MECIGPYEVQEGCNSLLCNQPQSQEWAYSPGYALISSQFWNDLPAREVNTLATSFIDWTKTVIIVAEMKLW